MKRKIIKLGTATLVTSLPSKWTRKFNLKSGDEVEVEERENELVVSTQRIDTRSTKEIDITDLDTKVIDREIVAAYTNGYDEIKIKYPTTIKNLKTNEEIPSLNFIQNIVNQKLIGMEIVEQKQTFCILKDLGSPQEGEFDRVLRRTFFLLLSLSEETIQAIKTLDKQQAASIKFSRQNIDRFINYCLRILTKKGHTNYGKTSQYFALIYQLKALTQMFHVIGTELQFRDKKSDPEVIKAVEEMDKHIKLLYDLFYKYNPAVATEIVKSRRKFFDIVNILLYKTKLSNFDYILISRVSFIVAHVFYLAETKLAIEV